MSDNVRDARAALEGVLRRVVGRFAVSTSIVQLAGTRPIPDAKVYAEWLRALVYKHNAKLSSQDLELLGNPPGIKHGIPVRVRSARCSAFSADAPLVATADFGAAGLCVLPVRISFTLRQWGRTGSSARDLPPTA